MPQAQASRPRSRRWFGSDLPRRPGTRPGEHLYRLLVGLTSEGEPGGHRPWLTLAVLLAAVPAAKVLLQAFGGDFVVQDDARQHIFWMRKWTDPELFRGDLIAGYFESVAPFGFRAVYWVPTRLGVDPMVVSKLLPTLLGLALAYYAFRFAVLVVPTAAAGLMASVLTTYVVWQPDIISSGLARAFAPPLLAAIMYYLAADRTVGVAATTGLLALLYPQAAVVAAGVLALWPLRPCAGRPWLRISRSEATRAAAGLLVAAAGLAAFRSSLSAYGPPASRDFVQAWPEFFAGGRLSFFLATPADTYFCSSSAGLLPNEWCAMLKSKLPTVGFFLVVLLLAIAVAVPLWLSWTGALQTEETRRRNANLPLLVVIVGAALFLLAHLVLFRLGDPNRYAAAPLRVVTPMGLGIAAALALARAVGWAGRSPKDEAGARRRLVLAGAAGGLGGLVLALAVTEPNPHFVRGRYPGLYAFLERQPKNALVASLSREADNLPSLARRPVLTSWEYTLPYNLGYVRPMRARTEDLIRALYGSGIEPMRALIEEYGIDLVLLEKDAFTVGHVSSAWWRRLYPEDAEAALTTLREGRPAVSERVERCMLYSETDLEIVSAACLAQ